MKFQEKYRSNRKQISGFQSKSVGLAKGKGTDGKGAQKNSWG